MSLPVHLAPDLTHAVVGTRVRLDGDEAHHAVAVRRMAVGERVRLVDGRGHAVVGSVTATGKRSLEVCVEETSQRAEPMPHLTVVQALPKGDRGELAVEVLTEIGVARIVPWAASRSVAVWRGERAAKSHAKWSATAREAAKQARRDWFCEVSPLASSAEVVALIATLDLVLVLHEDATTPLSRVAGGDEARRIGIVVGPEGGLSAEEVADFEGAGAISVRLGAEVLRTSTAGLAAAAAVLAHTGRWS